MSNVRDFGAVGDGVTDDTAAVEHCLEQGDGVLHFPRGDYVLSRTVTVMLPDRPAPGRVAIDGDGGTAKIVMAGEGPAFHLVGSHGGTAAPGSFEPRVWAGQRMPTVAGIEIEGRHADADGLLLEGTMQSTITGVLLRQLRHGIRLHRRARNVLIDGCHVYFNRGVGIYLDRVNMHQINITGSHISYNRLGGIRIEGSEVRNLQITGNDIEYNDHRAHGTDPEPTAEIHIDTTAEGASVNEVAVCSNTIQATVSPGGANIRILDDGGGAEGSNGRPPGLWTIAGNIIGSQQNNVHLIGCYGVVLSGNCIYSCEHRNLLIERSRMVTMGANSFRRHTPQMGTGVRLIDSADCVVSGCQFHDQAEEGQASGASLLEIARCERINVSGCELLDGVPFGIDVETSRLVSITGSTITEARRPGRMRAAIRFRGPGRGSLVAHNTLGRGPEGVTAIDDEAGVTVGQNVVDQDAEA